MSFRHVLASLHFNENVKRETQKDKEGIPYYKVTYPKFKLGEEVVWEVAIPPTYLEYFWTAGKYFILCVSITLTDVGYHCFLVGYVDDIRKIMFPLPFNELQKISEKYQEKVRLPMNKQFPERLSKEDALLNRENRKRTRAELFPQGNLIQCLVYTIFFFTIKKNHCIFTPPPPPPS